MPKKKIDILSDDLPYGDTPGRDELKALYIMAQDEAMAATMSWAEKSDGKRSPMERWVAAQELRVWRKQYQKGEKKAITEGLYLCALNDIPLPKWLAFSYLAAFRKVIFFKAKSWDDVFGRPHPKGTQLLAKRDKREKMFSLYNRIHEIKQRSPDTPIDESLFEKVGKEFGLGKSLTNEYYYEAKNRLHPHK